MEERIEEYTYEEEMKESFRDYAVSVMVGRALPDVRDGFKPVHRRVLYAMKTLGILPDTPYKKSARIVGEIIGKYHPHGDAAAYDTMVRLAQDFRLNVPLVDGHGNFGSIDGDAAAAMRYTEARLALAAMELLADLDKNVVDFRDNYDGTEREPVVLPAKFPQLLVNGSIGIAVGMRSNIPPHNFGEAVEAFLLYLNNPDAPLEELLEVMPGPDFPTGGLLTNPKEFREFYRSGEAKAVIRSKIEIESASYGKTNVVITEIPYPLAGNKAKLVADLTQLVVERKLNEVTDVRDESSKDGIRIVLEVKKGTDIPKFLTKLYSLTKVEVNESYQFLAIVDGRPVQLGLKEYFRLYLDFQKELTRRKYRYLYEKGLERKEILDGLMAAVNEIDAIIEAIRGSSSIAQMKRCLMNGETNGIQFRLKKNEKVAKGFRFTERQARAILDMKLQRLGRLEVEALQKEREQLEKELEKARKILEDDRELVKEIRKEHQKIKNAYAVPRRTLLQEMKQIRYTETKKEEDVWVSVDRLGYCRLLDGDLAEPPADAVYAYHTKDNDRLVVFTNQGNVHQVKLSAVPKTKKKEKGTTLHALAKLERGEYPVYVTVKSGLSGREFLFVTRFGLCKRTKGDQLVFSRLKMAATGLQDGDELVFVRESSENEQLVLVTKRGYMGRLRTGLFPVQTRPAKGVQSLALKADDEIEQAFLWVEGKKSEISVNGITISASDIPEVRRGSTGKRVG
ncbi:DNA topoisomerase (ATP-hydrolyzing) [Caldibacillus debilis]|uniref:DNA topoisomerase (ATP-hydrolyzing) n=1 Tax=Caldibacillus debilis GB1 TaxID=1339248 RepID=A0A420VE89_9BACI|nr:DNA topoisomerase (ATP-hydrolyzing) [Caldibacillus debilis]RKO61876.1 Type IIA topoisomerase (DNA gyrase/topo II, topoisomerase IV), A subunit [Caldibacillus debilis GB1]